MDDLIKICDELERCKCNKICYENAILCTKKQLTKYIGKDFNKLLKLKAELNIHENFENNTLNNLSFFVAACTLLITIVYNVCTESGQVMQEYLMFAVIILVTFLVILGIIQFFQKKTSARSKWRKYIAVVLEDMENKWNKD